MCEGACAVAAAWGMNKRRISATLSLKDPSWEEPATLRLHWATSVRAQ